ncbi:hypothetical protein LGV61_05145 [Desulfurispirillum indicum]|uniref:hypothetical protein n=1 Tax=Desulfurispirillum indicum TaxID=936456 RepID=UPI001CF99ED6|nr:hypothetical protein [Desulfurispirillum indicum]UCZ57661.1 hypothetical protein LGV61_05145 [Desulfurispirillum indicum]
MKEAENKPVSQAGQLMLESLRESVAEALEKKRRLGQYAVMRQNGKPVIVGDDSPGQKR